MFPLQIARLEGKGASSLRPYMVVELEDEQRLHKQWKPSNIRELGLALEHSPWLSGIQRHGYGIWGAIVTPVGAPRDGTHP